MKNIDIVLLGKYTSPYDVYIKLFDNGTAISTLVISKLIQLNKHNLILISKDDDIIKLGRAIKGNIEADSYCSTTCLWKYYLSLLKPDLTSCAKFPCSERDKAGNDYVFEKLNFTNLSLFQFSKLRVDIKEGDNVLNIRLTNKII